MAFNINELRSQLCLEERKTRSSKCRFQTLQQVLETLKYHLW